MQGPLFLIEYDASQNDGNHIHTVWRDFNGDFGRDLLREHYQSALGTRTGTRCGCCFFSWRVLSMAEENMVPVTILTGFLGAARPRCSTASSRKTTATASR